jgi:O-antigen ligase
MIASSRLADGLLLAILAALPTIGLVSGPAYAGLVFALGAIRLIATVIEQRRLPRFDPALAALAAGFVLLSGLGTLWSIQPARTLAMTGQMTGILAMVLIFLADDKTLSPRTILAASTVLPLAMLTGGVMLALDTAAAYPIQHLLDPRGLGSKYNRGIDYLILLGWPAMTLQIVWGRTWAAVAIALVVVATVSIGINTTARLCLVAAGAVWLVAVWLPRWVQPLLIAVTVAVGCGIPFAVRGVSDLIPSVVSHIKSSAVHRLEIWQYMSSRVMEKPLAGWGLGTSSYVPISPDEIKSFIYADGVGIYPHNQFLQLWVETGALGVVIGMVFTILVLRRIGTLPTDLRPFAYAAYSSAAVIAFTGFQISTDSWWAALAATAFLFVAARRLSHH